MPIIIIVSLMFYLFYKVKYFRTKDQLRRSFISAKSKIALGLLVSVFGINQYTIHYPSTTSLIIGIIFLVLGLGSIVMGYREFKFYYPYIAEKAKNA